jgi:hypothetical protein
VDANIFKGLDGVFCGRSLGLRKKVSTGQAP